ncbi:MAG TPA: hypothetical protein V6D00_12320 [Pantanalinema sp.]
MLYPGTQTLEPVQEPDQLIAEAKAQIKACRSFKSGKINKYAQVEGVREYPKGQAPFDRQVHHHDDRGRVVFFEKFVREFSRPSLRVYRYRDASPEIADAIWIDRYGRIENYHVYHCDPVTGLMLWRAEYDIHGNLFYSIRSGYDARSQLVEESWYDPQNRLLKRHGYTYDAKGELASELHHDAQNRLRGFNAFSYDARGNLLERRWHDGQGTCRSRFVYTIDKQDRVASLKLIGPSEKLQVKQDFTYDAQNNVIKEVWTDEKGAVVKELRF